MHQEYVKNDQGERWRYSFHLSGCLLSVKSWNAPPAPQPISKTEVDLMYGVLMNTLMYSFEQ